MMLSQEEEDRSCHNDKADSSNKNNGDASSSKCHNDLDRNK